MPANDRPVVVTIRDGGTGSKKRAEIFPQTSQTLRHGARPSTGVTRAAFLRELCVSSGRPGNFDGPRALMCLVCCLVFVLRARTSCARVESVVVHFPAVVLGVPSKVRNMIWPFQRAIATEIKP